MEVYPSVLNAAMAFKSGRIYLFGSILKDKPSISDVDILVVYDSEDGLAELKKNFLFLGLTAPIDAIYMTSSEERYLNFVIGQGARLVYPAFDYRNQS